MIRKIIFAAVIFISFNSIHISSNEIFVPFSYNFRFSENYFSKSYNKMSDDFTTIDEKKANIAKVFLGLGISGSIVSAAGLAFIIPAIAYWSGAWPIFVVGISLIALHLPFIFLGFAIFGYLRQYYKAYKKIKKNSEDYESNNISIPDSRDKIFEINLFSIGLN
jgi:hypothetical protein